MSSNESLQKVKHEVDDLGFTHEKFQQQFKGIKVEFSSYIAHAKGGVLRTMNGQFYDVGRVNTTPRLSNQQAFQKALDHTGAESYLWEYPDAAKAMDNYKKPEGELVILPKEFLKTDDAKLAYKFDIYATKPVSRGHLYIDAHTGKTLFFNPIIKHVDNFGHEGELHEHHAHTSHNTSEIDARKTLETLFVSGTAQTRYSGTRTIETRKDGNVYTLNDESRKVYTRDAKNQPASGYPYINNFDEFSDNDNNWTTAEHSAGKDDAALDAHWGAMMTYDYFLDKHSRNSFDNNGAAIRSYVHVGTNYDNAFWNGTVMSYGDGSSNGNEGNGRFDALTSIDVAAHEIGHAVCTNTADLAYQRESGAMNEGFSDIWGAAVEHFAKGNGSDTAPSPEIWLIGDEIDRRAGVSALRSMSNPNERGQPDTYGGLHWKDPNCAFPSSFNDYCGVHTNSGVLNYWFYLLTVGGTGTNDKGNSYNVPSIGMTKAAKIAYRLEANYLSENSTFEDARAASIIATTDLYGDKSPEVLAVMNAWYAVGVGELCFLDGPTNFATSNISDNQFTLSWDAVPGAASYTLEITTNATGATMPGKINVSGTSKTITGLDPGTEYNCSIIAKCSNGGSGTPSLITAQTTGIAPLRYCFSRGNSVSGEYIGRVQLGTIDNSTPRGEGYSDHTDISTDLRSGSANTITVTPVWRSTQYPEGYGAWIDFNQDGDFSDPGEHIWSKAPSNESPVNGIFVVPSDATLGATRMRVILKYNATPSPCEEVFSYGEVEDYTVVITSATSDDTEAPTTPSNLTASNVSYTSATLNWDASTDNIGVASYDIYNGIYLIGTSSTTSFDVSGLDVSTTYTLTVKARDAGNNLSEGADVTFTTLHDANPTGPSNLTVSNIDYTTANLTWGAPNGNIVVGFYEISLNGDFIDIVDDPNFTLTGLTEETEYTATITVFGPTEEQYGSASITFTTLSDSGDTEAPTTPTNLVASNISFTSATLTWDAATDNIGVVGYDIYQGTTLVDTTTTTSFDITGLTLNTSYTYSVKAKDAAGNISDAVTTTFTTLNDAEAPTAPTNLVASNISFTSATLTWNAATDNIGVVGYDIYQGTTLVNTTATTSFDISSLTLNTAYTYSVKAKDAAGNISNAATVTFTTLNDTEAPTTPANLVATNIGLTSATLTWNASSDNFGIAGYDVYKGSTLVGTTATTSFNITGLTLGTSYGYSVIAKDAAGNTSNAAEVTFMTLNDTTAPNRPTNVRATNITKVSATLRWNAATDNVGVVGYDIFRGSSFIGSTTSTSKSLSGLSAGTSYTYSVKAKDAAGNISSAASITFKTASNGPTYCQAKGNSTSIAWIDYVALGGMSKASGSNGGYANFTNKTATVRKGRSYLLTVSAGYASGGNRPNMFFAVWIDFNQNGRFDNNERVMTTASNQDGNRSTSISIPGNAKSGKTRMRVAMRNNREPSPCGTFSSGEVEDYTVNISNSGFFNGVTGIDSQENTSELFIYPNPAKNTLKVQLTTTVKDNVYRIININGQVVQSGKLDTSDLDISNLNSGIYILEVNNGVKTFKQKLIKK
ncbi:fibronectin type III domain-containing protein [Tenacibaculum amylolyticum]|uniref:fibronectin type III domain-containing protein n=1 Tax=Tenacibaculum amylolyticum TaxID=104269 RepID=UPI0038B57C6F